MANNHTGKLIWFVAGASIGSAIALLYAPQSGRDTRRIIGKKARQGREAVADASRDLYEKGRRVADDAAELFERGRRLVEG